jgi:hypothetical protein
MHPSNALIASLLSTLAITAGPSSSTINKDAKIESKIEAHSSKIRLPDPSPGFIIKYPGTQSCMVAPLNHIPPSTTIVVDKCYILNAPWLEVLKQFKLSSPAICKDGRRAKMFLYKSLICSESQISMSLEITDKYVGKCVDARQIKGGSPDGKPVSLAFVCDGVPENKGNPLTPIAGVISLLAIGLGAGFLCCGLAVRRFLSILGWVLWSPVTLLKVACIERSLWKGGC